MKTVFQTDIGGFYMGETDAEESPLEPGVYIIPARCVEVAPPQEWDEGKWPRWDGSGWRIVNQPKPVDVTADPVAKLRDFLAANPEVAALIAA